MCKIIVLAVLHVLISPGIAQPTWILRQSQDNDEFSASLPDDSPVAWPAGRLHGRDPTELRDLPSSASVDPEDSYRLMEAIRSRDKERIVEEMRRMWARMSDEQRQAVIDRYRAISYSRRGGGTRDKGRRGSGDRMLIRELPSDERDRIIQMRRRGAPYAKILFELKKAYERLYRGGNSDGERAGPGSSPGIDLGTILSRGIGGDSQTGSDGHTGVETGVDGGSDGDHDRLSSSETSESPPDEEGGDVEKQGGESIEKTLSQRTTTEDPGSDLLGSLLKGNIGKVDWLGSLLGTGGEVDAEHGNALAQMFSGGNIFNFLGPANK